MTRVRRPDYMALCERGRHPTDKGKAMPPMKQRDPKHLIDQIINRSEGVPSYALLLGAGASVTSGVKTAEEMVRDWRTILYEREQTDQPFADWLAIQPWHGEGEYGELFGMMHPLPPQRRTVVEGLVEKARPSWGYAYLANLLEHKYFNVVFTTNFDDLLTESCYRYTDSTRPLVAAHDSAMKNLRVNSPRLKIVKMHGDFLYDSIKNTPDETESLESNTADKLREFSRSYGLIVIGYSGRDLSVMDALISALDDKDSFPNGIYWCVYKHAPDISSGLHRIAEDRRVFVVRMDGFDELMAEINDATGKGLPIGLSAPYNRISLLQDMDAPALAHPIIAKDAANVKDSFLKLPDEVANLLPLRMLAMRAEQKGDNRAALRWWKQEYDSGMNAFAAYHIARILVDLKEIGELQRFVETTPHDANATYFLLLSGSDEEVINLATAELLLHPQREIPRINKAIALKRSGRENEMAGDLVTLENQIQQGQADRPIALRAGIAALRGVRADMMRFLRESLDVRQITVEQARDFPVFEDYRDDEDFQALLSSYEARADERG